MFGLEYAMAAHLFLQASSDQIACPTQKSARVDVRWRSETIKYDNTKTTADLNNRDIDSENPYGVHVSTDVGGLMTGKMEYKSGIQVSSIRYPTAKVACFWIDKVVVDVVIDPTIQIASEHQKGTCEYDAILEHEHKHVAIDRKVVTDYLERLRMAAAMAVQKVGMVGPKPDSTSEEYKKKMSDYVSAQVKAVADKMYADRTARQKAFDNKDEYDRVSAKCAKKSDSDAQ
ncbi:MAG: hypothetical protein KGQ41_01625 [Alphaproteobacteria bacterium]|nr:hypothetical protein [Alphaproteobacteria bacterium]